MVGPVAGREYDVCLSFAGEQRAYVERVARLLEARAVRVFYDTDERVRLWGEDLYEHLDKVYQHAATICVMFVSADYVQKLWTNHERKSAQARAFRDSQVYLLPARFDDTEVPGLRPTIGHIDLRTTTPEELAELIVGKLALAQGGATAPGGGPPPPEPPPERRPGPASGPAVPVSGPAGPVSSPAGRAGPVSVPAGRVFGPAGPVFGTGGPVSGAGIAPPVGRLPVAGVRGRDPVLAALRRAAVGRSGRVQVLAGIGGVGKSATALALCARRGRSRWPRRDVWWVSASDPASLTAGLVGLARRLGGSERDLRLIAEAAPEAPERLWALLARARRGWLLVVDNADDPQLLAAPRPVGSTASVSVADGTGWVRATRRGLVVVTSRVADPQVWGVRSSDVHRLEVLGADVATEVLLDLVRQNRRAPAPDQPWVASVLAASEFDATRRLAVALGGLPLALHLAGSVIASPFSSWASATDYLSSYQAAGVSLLAPAPDSPFADDPRATVMRTWELTLDALAAGQLPLARPLLRLVSCFAAAVPIPAELLSLDLLADLLPGSAAPGSEGGSSARDGIRPAVDALARTGLIDLISLPDLGGHGSAFMVHPLIAETSRSHLVNSGTDPTAAQTICRAAVVLLARAVTRQPADDPRNWAALRLLAPHLHALLDFAALRLPAADLVALLDATVQLVSFHQWTGADMAGEQLARRALSFATRVDPDQAPVVDLHFQLAHTLGNRGRWQEAEAGYRQVFESRSRVLGADHPRTLSARHQLAWVMANLGHWQDAAAGYRQILASRLRVLGVDHPRTLSARHQLAWVIGNLGHWQQAEAEFEQVLHSRNRILGPEHRDTLAARHWLAWVAGRQGRWEQAEAGYRSVLADRLRVLGADHRDTLATRDRLAWAIGHQGRWAEAGTAYQQVLHSRSQLLGPEHRDTLASRNQVAWVAANSAVTEADWDAAEAAYRQVLDSRIRVLGPEHPDTLTTRHQLAWVQGRRGRWADAESASRQVLGVRTKVLGADHPHTLDTRYQLAWILGQRERWDEADAESGQAHRSRLRLLGPDHPDTLASRRQVDRLATRQQE